VEKTLIKYAVLAAYLLCTACANDSSQSTVSPLPPQDDQVMCTQDAKQCADGSWVGRSGPNCEFVCPNGDGSK
jgi:hypothetical protein